jgi:hypothetical protein
MTKVMLNVTAKMKNKAVVNRNLQAEKGYFSRVKIFVTM